MRASPSSSRSESSGTSWPGRCSPRPQEAVLPILVHGETESDQRVLRALRLALELSFVILAVEAAGAVFSRSLSLTVDAIHNIPDILAFAVSWGALRATAAGAFGEYTFGRHRREVFAGLLNAALVLGTGLLFGVEAALSLDRGAPFDGPVNAVGILAAAIPTLALRTTNLWVLGRVPRRARELNLRSVLIHLTSDLVITGALLFAGIVLLFHPAAYWADAGAAIAIAVVLVYESIPLFQGGVEVLEERIPRNISLDSITKSALGVPSVSEIHDVHVWAVCPTLVCMTAHVKIADMSVRDSMAIVSELRERMEKQFGILHAVFQVEAALG
jgi:cobalt-zinc-cadmium efflux system protein